MHATTFNTTDFDLLIEGIVPRNDSERQALEASIPELRNLFLNWRERVFAEARVNEKEILTAVVQMGKAADMLVRFLQPRSEPFFSARNLVEHQLGSLDHATSDMVAKVFVTDVHLICLVFRFISRLGETAASNLKKIGRTSSYRDVLGGDICAILELNGHACKTSADDLFTQLWVAFDRELCESSGGRYAFAGENISRAIFRRALAFGRNSRGALSFRS